MGSIGAESLSLASVGSGVGGRGGTISREEADDGGEDELLEEGTGMGAVELETDVEMEDVVRCKADDKAAESEATEPITEERDVVGGVEE